MTRVELEKELNDKIKEIYQDEFVIEVFEDRLMIKQKCEGYYTVSPKRFFIKSRLEKKIIYNFAAGVEFFKRPYGDIVAVGYAMMSDIVQKRCAYLIKKILQEYELKDIFQITK